MRIVDLTRTYKTSLFDQGKAVLLMLGISSFCRYHQRVDCFSLVWRFSCSKVRGVSVLYREFKS